MLKTKMFVLAAALAALMSTGALAQVKPPAGFVEFVPEQGTLEAALQTGLQTAQQDLGKGACYKERFAGVPERQMRRVLLHCAGVEAAGSEEARQAQAQSNAPCEGPCLFQGAQVLTQAGFDGVAILLGRTKEGQQVTLVGATGLGPMVWTDRRGGIVGDAYVKSLEWEKLVTPTAVYRRSS